MMSYPLPLPTEKSHAKTLNLAMLPEHIMHQGRKLPDAVMELLRLRLATWDSNKGSRDVKGVPGM
jgi:hypothetical protein